MSKRSEYTKFLHNYPVEQNTNAVVHTLLILKKLSKRMRMKSKRLVQNAADKHKGGLITRSIVWEFAAHLIEEEIENLNERIKRNTG